MAKTSHSNRTRRSTKKKQVFLSWSGDRSRLVAESLHRWLPTVLDEVSPWISAYDLQGDWRSELRKQINVSTIGIVCVTREIGSSYWLPFECGALAAGGKSGLVCPYLFATGVESLLPSLEQFQSYHATKEGTWELIKVVSKHTSHQRRNLRDRFESRWQLLENDLKIVAETPITTAIIPDGRAPQVEVLREPRYAETFQEWNESGDGYFLAYNIEMNTFVNPNTFGRVWGKVYSHTNIKQIIFLLPRSKFDLLNIAINRLIPDLANDPLLKKVAIRVFPRDGSEPENLHMERIAFAMYRKGADPGRGMIHPRAILFPLTPPFAHLTESPYKHDENFWQYQYALRVNGDWNFLNTLDSIWHQQSLIATKPRALTDANP